MIQISQVYKRYWSDRPLANPWVLQNVNLSIPKGVSVGLIGGNGAGKSTLLRLIAGTDSPTRGRIERRCRMSWPIGLSGGLQSSLTGRQNTKFVARVQGMGSAAQLQRITRFVEDFAEIGPAFDEPVSTYSSGMKSRLTFGLSMAFDFDVYISDEATAVGDRSFKDKAKAYFANKVGQASLIMVSHSEDILRDLCQAGVYLKNGQAQWYDDINQALLQYHIDVDELDLQTQGTQAMDLQQYTPQHMSVEDEGQLAKATAQLQTQSKLVAAIVREAKAQAWPAPEQAAVRKLFEFVDGQHKEHRRFYNRIPRVAYATSKKELLGISKQTNLLARLANRAEQEAWPPEHQQVLAKALQVWQAKKMRAEIKTEQV